MRLRLTFLLWMMAACAVAQRGGGMAPGNGGGMAPGHGGGMAPGHGGGGGGANWGHPSPIRPPFPGPWKNRWWGGPFRSGFGPFPGFWAGPVPFDTPLCASPLFPLAPSCSLGDSFNPAYYQPPPQSAIPTPSLLFMPPPPVPPPPPPTANVPPADGASIQPQAAPASIPQTTPCGSCQRPSATVVHDDYPPVIVLTTGGMYSINKYWKKGKTIYFETTAGDTLYAPLNTLERIIPGSKTRK